MFCFYNKHKPGSGIHKMIEKTLDQTPNILILTIII